MKKTMLSFLLFIMPLFALAQENPDSLNITYFYNQIENEFPTSKKIEIQNRIAELNEMLAKSGLFPNVIVSASASYQSDVTEVPFAPPGMAPQFSKDHYNISVDVNQILFDGGKNRLFRDLEKGKSSIETAGLEEERWQISRQLEQIYFSILMLQKNKVSIEILDDDLQRQLSSVRSKVENGVLLPGNQKVLEAELLKIRQQLIQVTNALGSGFQALEILINDEIPADTKLLTPVLSKDFDPNQMDLQNPKLEVLESQNEVLGIRKVLAQKEALPTISAFGKAAYGRPGLNAFDDDLQSYWIVGIKTQWNFRSWRNSTKKAEILSLEQKKLEENEEIIRRNLKMEASAILAEIHSLEEQIQLDNEILQLRNEIVQEKENQLKQGVITSTEYLSELNAQHQARLNLDLKNLQLLQAKIEYLNTMGISWN